MNHLAIITLVVDDYDRAINWFCTALDFSLVEDTPSLTDDGRPKRWVVVAPKAGGCAILLARADGDAQQARIGDQTGGRVGFFLECEDFQTEYDRMLAAGVFFEERPRQTEYGTVAKFRDLWGNRWDLWQRK
ncbi:VOC family protein [Paracoccus aerodenitrificans]|uniref:VOC family protein n=1 Tax=Paracoccus aerodenitrificans TaxID=3017781 RepID=UPI0022F1325F|nr:VOC family protein [Paracoccus aerodenitrificans]WBU64002.1 VOC family protein [Paracoccus aerodenitrificans]